MHTGLSGLIIRLSAICVGFGEIDDALCRASSIAIVQFVFRYLLYEQCQDACFRGGRSRGSAELKIAGQVGAQLGLGVQQ